MSNLHDLRPSIRHSDLMLATPGKLFSANDWIFELKHDGFRCLVTKCGELVRLESRNGRDLSPYFPVGTVGCMASRGISMIRAAVRARGK